MSEWVLIKDSSHWALYKAELEKIPHQHEPVNFPCLVWSRYGYSGNTWEHFIVYQDDAEQLFGSE